MKKLSQLRVQQHLRILFLVVCNAATASGSITYDENVAVRFTFSDMNPMTDMLVIYVNFTNDDIITGFRSNSQATVNTGVAIADGGIRGNNATIDVSGLAAGSVKSIEITNFGVGYNLPYCKSRH